MGYLSEGGNVAGPSGSYSVERAMPKSGFGRAFLGRNQAGSKVLLKEVHLGDADAWKRIDALEREAHVTAHLRNPHIARFIELFAFDGVLSTPSEKLSRPKADRSNEALVSPEERAPSLILVREFVEGATLSEAIGEKRRFTSAELETIFRGLLEARLYLDTLLPTIVHGDASPSNVIVDPNGSSWLIDFGAVSDDVHGSPSAAVGTSGFMPPEQLAGRSTPASDLYAMAMTVLSAASHRAAHEMPLDPRTMRVSVSRIASGLPARMQRALEACLEPTLGKRVRNAREAISLLDGESLRFSRARGFLRSRASRLRTPGLLTLALLSCLAPTLLTAWPLWARTKHETRAIQPILIQGAPIPMILDPAPVVSAPVPPPPAPVVPAIPIQWTGSVQHAAKGLAAGDPCALILDVKPGDSSPECEVTLSCKDRVVATSVPTGECTMVEIFSASGALVYRAGFSSGPSLEAGSPVLAMDYETGLFRFTPGDGSGKGEDDVLVKLDPRSLPRVGSPILSQQGFEKPATVSGVVVSTLGAEKIKEGETCSYSLLPNKVDRVVDATDHNCNAVVRCGKETLYDGNGDCSIASDGTPYGYTDSDGSAADGDPAITVAGLELTIADVTTKGHLEVTVHLDHSLTPMDSEE